MGLTKMRLGDHIELCLTTNADMHYGAEYVRGVNNLKKLMPTKADINGRDLSKFSIVDPGDFVFNHRTSRNGSKFSIAYNDGSAPVICTEDYVVFRVKQESKQVILAEWLYLFFCRSEFDRYVITNSWGSSTEFYNWEDVCDIEIDLPPLLIQQKYVAIYKAMVANQQSYERGLEDLRLSFVAILDRIKKTASYRTVGGLLQEIDERNTSGNITNVQGINITKQFMPSVADTNGVNLKNYKVVRTGQFAYSGMQTGRDECIRVAYYTGKAPIIISPAYTVFIVNDSIVLPEFIMMWFSREESDRRGWFMSDSSIRTNLDLERFYEIEIPLPDLETQRSIVELYTAYITRRGISEKLKAQIRDICPILIKGSVEEGR